MINLLCKACSVARHAMHKVTGTVRYLVGPKARQAVQHSMNDAGILCPPQFVQQNRNQGRDLPTFHTGGFEFGPSSVATKALKYIFIAVFFGLCVSPTLTLMETNTYLQLRLFDSVAMG